MTTVVWIFIATTVAVHVAGSKLEATEGQNVTLLFETGLERVDEVRIIFEGESKGKRLLAKYCSPDAIPICDPIETPEHLHVEGNVSFVLVNVKSSRSGQYTAQIITADNRVFEETATLVVNKAPVSSSPAAPHSSSSSKTPRSSDLDWIVIVIPVVVISLLIVILGSFCFWKLRKKRKSTAEENPQRLLLSQNSVSKQKSGKIIAVIV